MNLFSLKVAAYDAKCRLLKLRRQSGNLWGSSKPSTFLFILCPPYCGSTLLHEILCSSPKVSANNIFGTREGQSLPEFRKIIDYRKRWDENYAYPWERIKAIWMNYWDQRKDYLLDKSPPNLLRTSQISKHFEPAVFIAMVRNPYVHCEALIRRDKMSAKQAAELAIKCLKYQKQNQEQLKAITLLRYEDLVKSPEKAKEQLLLFIPPLEQLRVDQEFKAHNYTQHKQKIVNFNQGKLERISSSDLRAINQIFTPQQDLLHFFGYHLYPDR